MRTLRIIEHISLDGVVSPGEPGEYSDAYAHGGWTAAYICSACCWEIA